MDDSIMLVGKGRENHSIRQPAQYFQHSIYYNNVDKLIKVKKISFSVAKQIKKLNILDSKNIVISAILIYLYRLNNCEQSSLHVVCDKSDTSEINLTSFFSLLRPININFTEKSTLLDALSEVYSEFLNESYLADPHKEVSGFIDYNIVVNLSGRKDVLPNLDKTVLFFDYNPEGDEIDIYYHLDVNRFDVLGELIKNSADHLLMIIKHIVENPNETINYFNYLTPLEEKRLLSKMGQGVVSPIPFKTLHQLFVDQAQRTPDHIALIFEDIQLTYKELDEQSNQLARYIQKYNPTELICLCLDRSLEMVISILAVLKAGCGYVPMDAQAPIERIKHMLTDTHTNLVLTQDHIEIDFSVQRVNVDKKPYSTESISLLKNNTKPTDLAYVIYTSGTTGLPKGVMVEHGGLVSRLVWIQNEYNLSQHDIVLQKTPYVFDVSVWEFLWPLLFGAKIVVARHQGHRNFEYLYHLIQEKRVTVLNFAPSMLSAFLNYLNLQDLLIPEQVRHVISCGEALSLSNVSNFYEQYKHDSGLHNLYGPTEASINVSYYECNRGIERVTIGKAIDNTQLYILDKNHQPLPIGVTGELYIGGIGLARGYLNQPELTKERFIQNPFSEGKIYKTGDLARYLPDGNIEYIGRDDFQVKIRGFRVELGEIEGVLSQYPGVQQTVVQYYTEPHGYLAAYYVSPSSINEDKLHQYAALQLPDYMLPSAYVHLTSLPLTVNGKLDRNALPIPEFKSQDYVCPRNELEEQIAVIWQEILGVERIGISDDFFKLGGHSILAMQTSHRMSNLVGKTITMKDIFQYKTIEQIVFRLDDSNALDVIPKAVAPYSLSYAQERLWFIERYENGSDVYHIPMAWELKAGTDRECLLEALQRLITRHAVLRSTYQQEGDGTYIQVVHDVPIEIERQILIESDLMSAIEKESHTPFDLTKYYPIRVCLYQTSDTQKETLLILMHHIAFDEWSSSIFLKELQALYLGQHLAPLGIQYVDYAAWQRSVCQLAGLDYWLHYLQDYETLNLATDYSRPKEIDYRGSCVEFDIDGALSEKIKDYASSQGVTVYTVLLSVVAVLLSRYSGQDDLVVGSPIANREHPGVAGLIGFFVNTLALRIKLDSNLCFNELLQRTHQTILETQAHQDIPFERIVDMLGVERDTSRHPLFQVMFNVTHQQAEGVIDLVKPLILRETISKFDLEFRFSIDAHKIAVEIGYAISLFKEASISRMAIHLESLLTQVIENDKVIQDYTLLTDSEYQTVVYDWNKTKKDYPRDKTLHQLFAEQVLRTPDHIALTFEDKQLTYKELDEQSNQLARYIQRYNPTELICLCLDRSLEMVISILAVLKAGCGYVPMDTQAPIERIKHMLADTHTNLVLTQDHIKIDYSVQRVNVDKKPYSTESISLLKNNTKPTDLAYVIYTSGTTGLPKGVMVGHGSVVNYCWNVFDYVKEIESVDFSSNLTFDFSVTTTIMPLLLGKRIVIYGGELKNVECYVQHLKDNAIDFIKSTPSYLSQILIFSKGLYIKKCFIGGEAVTAKQLSIFTRHIDTLYDEYGPTEATVGVTLIQKQGDCYRSIGKPYPNSKVYILDSRLNPLPIGATGELYIGGIGVARGYLNQPELTKERFIQNPFSEGNVYKTGDLARYLPDGNIEYIGRNDFQIKIRGFRIELGEIERVLSQYPEVTQANVQYYAKQHEYLVAYYVSPSSISEDKLRQYAALQLPDYMLPSAYVHLTSLPLTVNGKLDRKALPIPEFKSQDYVCPRNELEGQITVIWQDILGVERVGIYDNFFKLGGNSIVAIQLTYLMNLKLHSQLRVADIFKFKTPAELSYKIETSPREFAYQDYIIQEIDNAHLYEDFPLSNVQQAYYLGRYDDFELGNVNTHCYMEFKFASLDVERLQQAFNVLLARHLSLRIVVENGRQRYLQTASYQIQEHVFDNEIAFLKLRELYSHKLYQAEVFPLFDVFVSHCHHNDNYDVLHISMDALLLDGHSLQIFFKELNILYQDINTEFEPLSVTGRDYIMHLERLRESELFEQSKAYWVSKVVDYQFDLALPLIISPSEVNKPHFARVTRVIDIEVWKKIEAKAQRLSVGPTALMLVLYGKVLCHWSNQDKVCINLTLFNRLPLHADINQILGDFTVLELFNYEHSNTLSISEEFKLNQDELWADMEHVLFDGLDVQRMARSLLGLSSHNALAPVVLTSLLGLKRSSENTVFLNQAFDEEHYSITQTSQIWLDNKVYCSADGLTIEWDYVEQLFARETIEQMHADFCYLVEQLVDCDWSKEVCTALGIGLEEQALISQANADEICWQDKTLVGYVDQFASNDRCAIIDESGDYSFELLHQQSIAVANELQDSECELVAIWCGRGYAQIVASLGVMRSGRAYLPLSLDWPIDRINDILSSAKVSVVIVDHPVMDEYLRSRYCFKMIGALLVAKTESFLPVIQPTDVAYVIYTSGSTGRPKGVTISHQGAMNTILAVNKRYKVGATDKILALSDFSFDLSVYDIFGVLGAGGTVVFPKKALAKEPNHWHELIERYGITLWNSVPQLAQLYFDTGDSYHGLRVLLLSGDFVPMRLVHQIYKVLKASVVVSLGGATEGSIWSIWHEVRELDLAKVPYGVAMPNQKIYVLNRFGEHCSVGVLGEIHIGGIGVALNYYRDETKTNQSFIEHASLGRLYKTGDLGKWHRAGYIEFVGRIDTQVKINGYRVELDEISQRLREIPGINDAVTLYREHFLCAYLVTGQQISSIDKEAFKLSNKGLRTDLEEGVLLNVDIDNDNYTLHYSHRYFGPNLELGSHQLVKLIELSKQVSPYQTASVELQAFLKPLIGLEMKDRLLYKRLYPSAGGSYSVRSYVVIHQPLDDLLPGCYYFHPIKRMLYRDDLFKGFEYKSGVFSLHFVAYWPAIEPLYGKESRRFAYIEAGHMLGLLPEEQISSWEVEDKSFDSENTCLLSVYVGGNSVKPDIPTLNSVCYQRNEMVYENQHGELYDLSKQSVFMQSNPSSGQILNNASMILELVGELSHEAYLWSGRIFQRLAMLLHQEDVGSCMLGLQVNNDSLYIMALGQKTKEQAFYFNEWEDLIQKRLAKSLPDYMIPRRYEELKELPLTANGKIALKALPILDFKGEEYIAPRNALEQQIATIWQDVLGVKQIGIQDDFFKLGGHSILVIQLIHLLRVNLKLHIEIADVFRFKTIERLSDKLVNAYGPRSILQELSISDGIKENIYCIHTGYGHSSESYKLFVDRSKGLVNLLGFEHYYLCEEKPSIKSMEKLASHYLKHMQLPKNKTERVVLLGWSLGGNIAIEMAYHLETSGYTNITLYLLDSIDPIQGKNLYAQDLVKARKQLRKDLLEVSMPMDEINKRLGLVDICCYLLQTAPKRKLKSTSVVLFKAMKRHPDSQHEFPADNGLKIVFKKPLEIVPINQTHDDMMNAVDEIWNYIIQGLCCRTLINQACGSD